MAVRCPEIFRQDGASNPFIGITSGVDRNPLNLKGMISFFLETRNFSHSRARKNKYFREKHERNTRRENADIKIHANKLFVDRISHRIESITKVGIKYFPRRNNKKKNREKIARACENAGAILPSKKTCRITASLENVIYNILFHYLPRI